MQFFTRAEFEPGPLVAILLAAAWYVWAARRYSAADRPWPASRTVSFFAALGLMAVSLLSGMPVMAHHSFNAYGAQYIMTDLVAPVLVAIAAPLTLIVKTGGEGVLRFLEGRGGRIVTSPLALWLAFAASICTLFFSGLYGYTVGHRWAEQIVFLAFAVVGWFFWWPVVDVDPRPRRLAFWPRILYLLLTFPLFAIVGMGLESATSPIAPGVPIGDLHTGAAVMWVAGESLILLGVIAVFVQWLKADEGAARRKDQMSEEAAERQLALWRATRDAATRAASSS